MPTRPFLRANQLLLNASCGFLLSGTLFLGMPGAALAELAAKSGEAESHGTSLAKPSKPAVTSAKPKAVSHPSTTHLKSPTTAQAKTQKLKPQTPKSHELTIAAVTKPVGNLHAKPSAQPTTDSAAAVAHPTVNKPSAPAHDHLKALHQLEAQTGKTPKAVPAPTAKKAATSEPASITKKLVMKKLVAKPSAAISSTARDGGSTSNGLKAKPTDDHHLVLAPYHTHLPATETATEKQTISKIKSNSATASELTHPTTNAKEKVSANKLAAATPKLEKVKLEKLKPSKTKNKEKEEAETTSARKEKARQEKERKKQQTAARKHPDPSALNNLPGVTVSNPGESQSDTPMEMVSLVNGGVSASLHEVRVKLDRPTLIGLVEKNNLDLRIADSRVGQAKGAYFGSYGNLMPSIRSQLYVERYNGGTIIIQATPVDVNRVTYRPRISLDYQLPLGGKPIFQIRAARYKVASQDYARDQALQDALFNALAQYYEMIRNRMSRVVTEQSLASMELLVKVNEAKLKSGFGTRYEIEQAKVQLAERQNQVLEARNGAAISSIALASTLNLPVESEFTPDIDALTPVRFIDPQLPMSHFLAKADIQRPDLKQLAAEIKVARAAYQSTFSDLLPTFGLTSYVGGVGPRTDQLRGIRQGGISLDIDILKNMGVNTVGNIKTARARLAESIAEREKRVNEIHRQLATAYLDWQRYTQQIHVMKQKADAAEEAYRLSMARFKTGFGIQLEVLQSQTDYTNAIQEIQTAILNYNTTQLRLLRETGRLTPENVLLGEEETNFFSHKPDLLKLHRQAMQTPTPIGDPATKVPSPVAKEG
jgi:outer membrane protein TolC